MKRGLITTAIASIAAALALVSGPVAALADAGGVDAVPGATTQGFRTDGALTNRDDVVIQVADGTDPSATGCAADAITARSDYGDINGVNRVFVELRYSPRCRTAWARMTSVNLPNCVVNADWCGGATVHRNSDGREYSCITPNGTHGCYTRQVNDAGVTSYARGYVDSGARTAYATTGSYLAAAARSAAVGG
ncbi:hypothetical protein ALI22I_05440 [Saccharothrix sp. ALI-22-I]|uniref:DUF2690 domain-containing protein n=1 Tax=Saccharothrix sp. ALI-22-I TaxID=1933778 RepID=UPI00097BEFF9|nr:DUF2690 domain-containing protein [Saccharothrix sp. ALI-22-I]ONI92228.1 hypothetical protein ALI22I_05440 [Saccharothrix sp. ALI-22-I]